MRSSKTRDQPFNETWNVSVLQHHKRNVILNPLFFVYIFSKSRPINVAAFVTCQSKKVVGKLR